MSAVWTLLAPAIGGAFEMDQCEAAASLLRDGAGRSHMFLSLAMFLLLVALYGACFLLVNFAKRLIGSQD
jgi:hypothetical protein